MFAVASGQTFLAVFGDRLQFVEFVFAEAFRAEIPDAQTEAGTVKKYKEKSSKFFYREKNRRGNSRDEFRQWSAVGFFLTRFLRILLR